MIALNLVGTDSNSGTKTYNVNFLNQLNLNHSSEDLIVYVSKSYTLDLNLRSSKKIKYKIKSDLFNNFILRFFWMQFLLPIELKINNVKTLFSGSNYSPFLIKVLNIRSVLFVHTVIPWQYLDLLPGSKIKNFLIKKMMEISIFNSQVIIVPSFFAKKILLEKFVIDKKKIVPIYLGADHIFKKDENTDTIKNFDYDKDYILSVLSCVKYHNILNLLKAYKIFLKETHVKINYVIILNVLDKKYFDILTNFVKNNFEKDTVIFLSNIENRYLSNIYKNSHIYVFTSYSETFGFTTLEAMNYNVPLLVSKTSALEEINGDIPEYFDPDNIEEIKIKLTEIFQNTKDLKILESSKKRLNNDQLKKFLWKNNYIQTLELLKNII